MAVAVTTGTRGRAARLTRMLAWGAVGGAFAGFLVGGVLGRLAMRLLAVTSPGARGGITDDQAVVGEISVGGSGFLAFFTIALGAVGGLVYLWVRRVLPGTTRGRVLGYGLFTGAVGGALFVHDHPSFDYTVLTPAWLAVALFVALPAAYGLAVAALVEALERGADRVPLWLVSVVGGAALALAFFLTVPMVAVAYVVGLVPAINRAWRSPAVTVAGRLLYAVAVLWGGYGLVADIASIATGIPSPMPFNF
jgi:hypothetical protein